MPSSRGSSQPRDQTRISCVSRIAGGFFTTEPQGSQKCLERYLSGLKNKCTSFFWIIYVPNIKHSLTFIIFSPIIYQDHPSNSNTES